MEVASPTVPNPSQGIAIPVSVASAPNGGGMRLGEAMVRTGKGDPSAFAEVYNLTSTKLFSVCFRICRERPAAEDILNDVYLTVWKKADLWDARRGTAITWLTAIARNRSIDWQRLQRSRPQMTNLDDRQDIIDPAIDAETSILRAETVRLLHRNLASLEPRAREAIREAFFQEVTYEELARRLGIPLGTMKSCIRRGLAKLRADFDMAEVD